MDPSAFILHQTELSLIKPVIALSGSAKAINTVVTLWSLAGNPLKMTESFDTFMQVEQLAIVSPQRSSMVWNFFRKRVNLSSFKCPLFQCCVISWSIQVVDSCISYCHSVLRLKQT